MNFPRLPKIVQGLAGPIRVDRPIRLANDDWGGWHPEERRILIRSTLTREVAYATFLHECVHAALHDAGVALPGEKEEAVCDAVASGMMHVVRTLLL